MPADQDLDDLRYWRFYVFADPESSDARLRPRCYIGLTTRTDVRCGFKSMSIGLAASQGPSPLFSIR